MTEKILVHGMICFAVMISLFYLNRSAQKPINISDKQGTFLRMNKFYGVLGIISLLLGLIVSTKLLLENEPLSLIILTAGVFWGSGLPCLIYYIHHFIRFDRNSISVRNFSGKTHSVLWTDIKKISFSPFSGLLTIRDQEGKELKVHQHLVGFSTFIKVVEEKTPWRGKDLKVPSSQ